MSDETPSTPSTQQQADDIARVIVLVYGLLDGSRPFWCYVAVKPSKYKDFIEAQNNGTLNLVEFKMGEVIVSGEGTNPPDAVTLKVAEIYQTDPKNFFQPIDPEAEVERKVKEFNETAPKE